MKTLLFSFSLFAILACSGTPTKETPAATAKATPQPLASVVAGPQRSAENKARDQYRHPLETLTFFGLKDGMDVIEISPGNGWYTEILAPYLKDNGHLTVAGADGASDREYSRKSAEKFKKKMDASPDVYGKVTLTVFDPPGKIEIAPAGSADMVVTFRNLHNWMSGGQLATAFKTFYTALKPGGILGIEEHRGKPGSKQDPKAESGYITQDFVIKAAEAAGFKLADKSEINANPKDNRKHPEGVWTLPPSLRLGEKDKQHYLAIGESDRMTLKFVKP